MVFFRVAGIIAFMFFCWGCHSDTAREADVAEDSVSILKKLKKISDEIQADRKAKEIDEIIAGKVRAGFNGNVLVAQKDVIIYQKSFGMASVEDSLLLNADSKFQLASLSKTFTAVAVMKLVEEGKLSLDLTVKDYYPAFPYQGVTIRSLLSHRSGLPYYQYEFDKKVRSQKLYPDNQQLMSWFSSEKPTPRPLNLPDHFFSYNNTNYAVLAALVEKASGMSFDDYLRKKVLWPVDIRDTFAANTKNDSIQINRTFGYQNGRRLQKDFYDDIVGDKGIYSTAPDLLRWYQALRSEAILSKESLREMYTPRSFEYPGLRNYGYGFRLWVNDKQQTDYIYHTGWWKGYNTIMFFDLRDDFVIILLSNKYNRTVYNIRDIINILHGKDRATTVEESILDQ